MAETVPPRPQPAEATGVLVLADGGVLWGRGFGAEGATVGEVCFNTAMTGYQEVMTDPSYAAQIVTFTFPHIGNVGANAEDVEAVNAHALGCIVREDVTAPSSFRSSGRFDAWLRGHGRIGLSGIDTRALTRAIRLHGAPNGVIAHAADGVFDISGLLERAKAWPGLEGMDLAKEVSTLQSYRWDEGLWSLEHGYAQTPLIPSEVKGPHVVAIDYGLKRNILRNLVNAGARVTVVPATATYDDVMAHKPDGVFLSNGPGDPAATGEYAVPVIQALLKAGTPLFGICLGHQLLGLAIGAKTYKMHQGHRGANHPVKRTADGRVEITSMNHGFAVEAASLPETAEATHLSLFDGSLAGLALKDKPAFSVQYHPEASPGPQDSHYLFERFVGGTERACPMPLSFSEIKNEVLLVLYDYMLTADDTAFWFSISAIREGMSHDISGAFAKRAIDALISSKDVEKGFDELAMNEIFALSNKGIGKAEGLIKSRGIELRAYSPSPDADRIISRLDELELANEITDSVRSLSQQVRESNEIGIVIGDSRDMVLGEIEAAEHMVSRERFRLRPLVSLLMPSLRFLTDRFVGQGIGELAKQLAQLLMKLF